MSKHTEGPWLSKNGNPAVMVGEMTLARVFWPEGRNLDEKTANAILMAAAPDLLTAIESLALATGEVLALQESGLKVPHSVWSEVTRCHLEAFGAIQKARGF